MFCSHCGARVNPTAAICGSCGTRIVAGTLTGAQMTRPTTVTILAVLQFISGFFTVLLGIVFLFAATAAKPSDDGRIALVFAVIAFGLAAYSIICGIGLWKLRSYGRTMQMIGSGIGLLGIPIGTLISIAILIYMSKPGIKVLFSGKEPHQLTPDEVAAVQKVSTGGAGVIIAVVAVAVGGVFVIGIIAAIAIPGLLRARIAGNEASARGVLRLYVSAEAAYAATNNGLYDTPACLLKPAECVPDFRGNAFLAEDVQTRSGYQFHWAGTAVSERTPGTSPSSVRTWVMMAVPLSASTGGRMFCVDDTGVIRSQSAQLAVPRGMESCPAAWPEVP